jgi:hypothetical protein
MTDLFDMSRKDWSFTAVPSCLLAGTTLPLGAARESCTQALHPTQTAAYWAAATQGMDFSSEDKVDAVGFNRIVWRGLMATPYPAARSGAELSLRAREPTRQP